MRSIVMRVRNNHRRQPTHLINLRNSFIIDERKTIPEDVSGAGPAEEGALADADFRDRMDANEIRGGWVWGEDVFVLLGRGLECVEGCPGLPSWFGGCC